MRRSVVFATPHLQPLIELARIAESEGYHRVWTTEYPDRDAVVRCALIGAATSTIQIGTGIAYSFTRHPVTLAAACVDIHESTRGRFSLGLGAATKGMRRRWYGNADARPVARMRETVEVLRALWASKGSVSFHGDFFDIDIDSLDHDRRLGPLPRLRVLGSGLNASMVSEASTWCDGLLRHPLAMASTSDESAKSPEEKWPASFELSQWVITSVNENGDAARDLARRSLAFYLSTPSYAEQFSGTPWEDVPQRVIAAFREQGPTFDKIADLVPPAMVERFCIAGTPEDARSRLSAREAELAQLGVSELVLQVAVTSQNAEETSRSLTGALIALSPGRQK